MAEVVGDGSSNFSERVIELIRVHLRRFSGLATIRGRRRTTELTSMYFGAQGKNFQSRAFIAVPTTTSARGQTRVGLTEMEGEERTILSLGGVECLRCLRVDLERGDVFDKGSISTRITRGQDV